MNLLGSAISFFEARQKDRSKNRIIARITAECQMKIFDNIDAIESAPSGISQLTSSWEWLLMCRSLMADHTGEKYKTILAEAENLHRRFLFSMGVALALFLVAFQALLRLIIWFLGIFWNFFSQWDKMLPSHASFLVSVSSSNITDQEKKISFF